jgi:zinc-binding alcohol dehydrogenase/oxidoreductase
VDAVLIREPGSTSFEAVPDPEPQPGEVVVELRAAALNRRDLRVRAGEYGDYPFPLVPGSDGAGVRRDTGDEVVILPSLGWGPREDHPGADFRVLGGPDWGTFAELIAIPAQNVFAKPRRLSWQEAAALPLAGLTAYRALFARGRLVGGERVLVLGAGSGVSTFAIQLALQVGAHVVVTSSSQEKLEHAKELGADRGVLYTQDGWPDEVGEVDLVLDSVGSTWPESLRCLRPGGRLVVFGATGGADVSLDARSFYFGQYSILGTGMGSPRDFVGLLRMVEGGSWAPVLDSVRPLAEAEAAFARLEAKEHQGKLVLEVA